MLLSSLKSYALNFVILGLNRKLAKHPLKHLLLINRISTSPHFPPQFTTHLIHHLFHH